MPAAPLTDILGTLAGCMGCMVVVENIAKLAYVSAIPLFKMYPKGTQRLTGSGNNPKEAQHS